MSNEQKRAEITDLLYALINREIEKKEKDINITLIDECYELLRSLKSVKEFSSEEIDIRTEAILSKTNIRTHKNKKIKIRLIAAIIAILLLMGIATYTFYDELAYEIEQVYRSAKPGVLYRNEKFDLEISENYIIFSSIRLLGALIE
ncbi:MAG: hypothetical protein IKU52_00745 [Clostridia bacterium]|nr:hypothetical protein [Clostridia bacterium]